jgi:hypothetical protein
VNLRFSAFSNFQPGGFHGMQGDSFYRLLHSPFTAFLHSPFYRLSQPEFGDRVSDKNKQKRVHMRDLSCVLSLDKAAGNPLTTRHPRQSPPSKTL